MNKLFRLFKKIGDRIHALTPEQKRLKDCYKIFASSPESDWIIGWKEAKKIHRLIKARRPKNILELGTGIGTTAAIMALAAPDSQITTVEQKEKCLAIARRLIPTALQKRIIFHLSQPVVFSPAICRDKEQCSGYETLPLERGPFDLVVVDGPSAFEQNGQIYRLPNGDLFNLTNHITPQGVVFIDNRKEALVLYKKYLFHQFKILSEWRTYTILEKIKS
jgi:predicted O-methyltransferase YrrM